MREYVNNLAENINGLTKKTNEKFFWNLTSKDTVCVQKTKALTKTLKPFRLPKENESLIVKSDASLLYWGGVLKTKGLDNIERIARYAFGRFSDAEINYLVHEKEVLPAKNSIERI